VVKFFPNFVSWCHAGCLIGCCADQSNNICSINSTGNSYTKNLNNFSSDDDIHNNDGYDDDDYSNSDSQ
jgi:hypothetical protein